MAPSKTEIEKICESAGAPLPLRDGYIAHVLVELGLTTALLLVSCHAELGQETPTSAAMTFLWTMIWTKMAEVNANGGVDGVQIDMCRDPNGADNGYSEAEKKKVNDFLSAYRWLQVCGSARYTVCSNLGCTRSHRDNPLATAGGMQPPEAAQRRQHPP